MHSILCVTKKTSVKSPLEPELDSVGHNFSQLTNFLGTIDKAQYLSDLVSQYSDLELTAPTENGVVWFRYIHDNVQREDLDGVNRMILYELWRNNQQIDDEVVLGKYSLKVSNITQNLMGLRYPH